MTSLTNAWILRCAQNDRYRELVRIFLSAFLVLGSLLLAPCARATELTDLGSGLAYLRIHSVAESEAALRKAVPGAGALVLDLRYTTAGDESAAALKTALASRPANTPFFILVSPATPSALAPAIVQSPALTLGAPGSAPAPKVVVQTDAATDRRAYEALETGTSLEKLISGRIEKERFDEATLVHEFKNGNPAPLPGGRPGQTPAGQQAGTVQPDPTAPKSTLPGNPAERGVSGTNTGTAAAGNGALTDRVLQRAVHLHRALQALRR